MPIFEYRCSECGNVFEELRDAGSESAPSCPKCGSKKVNKMISRFAAKGADGFRIQGNSCGSCSGGSCSTCR